MKGLIKGLATTLSTAMRKPVTIEYPDVKHVLPVRQRSFPVLTWDFDHDEPFCTGCMVCVRNCPVDCMTAVMGDNPKYASGESNRRKVIQKFWIDYGRCMRCNICVEVCNFEAIVMDNNWSGHEHAAYDRRDLHLDLDDLLEESRSGRLTNPYHPADDLEANIAVSEGKEIAEPRMHGARPQARQAQLNRVAQGLPAGIREREPELPKAGAAQAKAASAVGEEVEILSESKIRARRMRAERAVKELQEKGEPVPAEVLADLEKYRNMKPGEAGGVSAPAGARHGGGAAGPTSGVAPDGTMVFPPGVGTGDKGDPNSAEKVRARRMRAERKFKELTAAGEAISEDVSQTLYDLGSDLAPGGSIWSKLVSDGGRLESDEASVAVAAAPADGQMVFPPGIGTGPKGDPNSYEKVRARRMRAERKAREAVAAGEPVPADVVATIRELGGEVPGAA